MLIDQRIYDVYAALKSIYRDHKISGFGLKELDLFEKVARLAFERKENIQDFLNQLGFHFTTPVVNVKSVQTKKQQIVVTKKSQSKVESKKKDLTVPLKNTDRFIADQLRSIYPNGVVKGLTTKNIRLYWKIRGRLNIDLYKGKSVAEYIDSLTFEDGFKFKCEKEKNRSRRSLPIEELLRLSYPDGIVKNLSAENFRLYCNIWQVAKKKNSTMSVYEFVESLEFKDGVNFKVQ